MPLVDKSSHNTIYSPPLSEYRVPMRVWKQFSTKALKAIMVSLTCDFCFRG